MELSFLDIDGTSIEYRLIPGDKSRPVLVLLHEGLGCVAMWKQFPDRLAARTGASVFAYSRPGYGGSSPAPPPWPLEYMQLHARTWLPAILEAMELESFVLVGHSDGASIAAVFGGETSDHRLQGLSLMAPHFFAEEFGLRSIERARLAYETGHLRERLARYHGANVDCAFYGWSGAWLDPNFRQWNLERFLPQIRVPLQIIQGVDDEYGTADQIRSAQEHYPGNVDVLMLDACGHAPFRDQPDATLNAIDKFVIGPV